MPMNVSGMLIVIYLQAKIEDYGVFINVGAANYGLLHKSQMKVSIAVIPASVYSPRLQACTPV